mmetsp:Transcript_11894/g.25346  ORF Transcript_11894/g.25346 Transcript_11894/m.25346 type:complete len:346 (+) Transcript_11894:131-1168(+)
MGKGIKIKKYVAAVLSILVSAIFSRHNGLTFFGKDGSAKGLPLPWGIRRTSGGPNGASWTLVDWQRPITAEEDLRFYCEMIPFRSPHSGKETEICVHPSPDFLTEEIKKKKFWDDCNILPNLWNKEEEENYDGANPAYYLEIGANIGSCVVEMLLSTNATIIAFEPHPMNLFNLKKTVSKMDKSYQDRLMLFPVGLGGMGGTQTIFSAHNNMGNSVIGKAIGDTDEQKFDETRQFTINVERLDSILDEDNIKIKLMKMDAQGFECNILEGIGVLLAKTIDVIKFEYASQLLHQQGCMNLIQRLYGLGFIVSKQFVNGGFRDAIDSIEGENITNPIDLFASNHLNS